MGLPSVRLDLSAFLEWENAQADRNEYFRGEVFAMVGARRVHGIVAGNMFGALLSHLRGQPCRAFTESYKVQVGDDAVLYPDVFVTCDRRDLATEMIFRHPLLVVEVLSEGTQSFDRGLKFAAYRQIDALREYVLIDPDLKRCEVYRRNERGNFELLDFFGSEAMVLDSVGLTLPMAELFDGLAPPAA